MPNSWRRRLVTRLPGVGWRDERLRERAEQAAALRAEIRTLTGSQAAAEVKAAAARAELAELREYEPFVDPGEPEPSGTPAGTPHSSFHRNLLQLRRQSVLVREGAGTAPHPLRLLTRKLANYQLAESHGIPVPRVYATWPSPAAIRLDDLPDSFVIKSDGGAGSRGVLPVRRLAGGRVRVIGTDVTYDHEQLVDRLRTPSLRGPFFAEELLEQDDAERLPEDLKVYACYGQIGHIMLRNVGIHARTTTFTKRYVDDRGRDLGADIAPRDVIDPGIPLPANFAQLVSIARHLSSAITLPFARIDFYDTPTGIVFGEITRTPGGAQLFHRDHDRALGLLWDRAQVRIDLDVMAGRPLALLHGEHPYPAYYSEPVLAGTPGEQVGNWPRLQVPCATWCRP